MVNCLATLASHPLVFRSGRKLYPVLSWKLQKNLIASYWFTLGQALIPKPVSIAWEVQWALTDDLFFSGTKAHELRMVEEMGYRRNVRHYYQILAKIKIIVLKSWHPIYPFQCPILLLGITALQSPCIQCFPLYGFCLSEVFFFFNSNTDILRESHYLVYSHVWLNLLPVVTEAPT